MEEKEDFYVVCRGADSVLKLLDESESENGVKVFKRVVDLSPRSMSTNRDISSCYQNAVPNSSRFDIQRRHLGSRLGVRPTRNFEMHPEICGHEVVGDSILFRMMKDQGVVCNKFSSLCYGGQKVCDVLERIDSGFKFQYQSCVMMIGTNDLIQRTSSADVRESYIKLVNILVRKMEKVVILTIPPICKVDLSKVLAFNEFLGSLSLESRKVVVCDVFKLFVHKNNTVRENLFEKYFFSGAVDLVHPNKYGLRAMWNLLKSKLQVR